MKIAMFTDAYWPRVNGVTVSVDSFSQALVKEGNEILIVCAEYPQEAYDFIALQKEIEHQSSENLINFLRVPSVPLPLSKEDRIAKYHKWNWVIKKIYEFNPDIIHIHTEFVISEFGIWYARIHNLPVIYTFHTMWEDYAPHYFPIFSERFAKSIARTVIKRVLMFSYRVIVPTAQMEATVKRYSHKTKTCLIPTGIDINQFKRDKAESADFRKNLEELFPKLKDKRILLFAGRVAKEKNIGFLFNILPEILAKHPDVILLIAGNGPDIDYYKEEARKSGIEEFCVFSGYFDRKDLALVYSLSEIFLFPSLTDTQGLVTLEAMLSGTPVVAIGALGTLTVMGGDNGGFMVKNNLAEFTARTLDLLGDPELYKKKSEEAIIHASSWSIEEMTNKLITLYRNTMTEYIDEYGDRITPVREILKQKGWWKNRHRIIKKKVRR